MTQPAGKRIREAWSILFLAIGLFLIIALLTFNPNDPGWTRTGSHIGVANFGGSVGAWFADLTLYLLGYLAYLLPVLIFHLGWRIFRGRSENENDSRFLYGVKLFGFIILCASATALASLHFLSPWPSHQVGAGGLLGDQFAIQLLPQLNKTGTTLFALSFLFIGLTLYTGISWVALVEGIGKQVFKMGSWIASLPQRFKRPEGEAVVEENAVEENIIDSTSANAQDFAKVHSATAAIDPINELKTSESTLSQPDEPSAKEEPEEESLDIKIPPEKKRSWLSFGRDKAPEPLDESSNDVESVDERLTNSLPNTDSESIAEPVIPPIVDRIEPHLTLDNVEDVDGIDGEPEQHRRAQNLQLDDSDVAPVPAPFAMSEPEPLNLSNESVAFDAPATYDETEQAPAAEVAFEAPAAEPSKAKNKVPISDDIPVAEQIAPQAPVIPTAPAKKAPQTTVVGELPSPELLDPPSIVKREIDEYELQEMAQQVETRLAEFGIKSQVKGVYPGPVVTRLEVDLAPGTKASKVTGLSQDLARALLVASVRVVEVIPGKSFIGIELPNPNREIVRLREVVASSVFDKAKSPLTLVLGKDISGKPIVADLAKMPHLLVAGTTGSGKSVGINVMLLSLLFKSRPDEVRLIMVDPKMLELSVYEGIPHLLTPVVTDMKEASNALRWAVGEMERRYKLMSKLGVRNIAGYNKKVEEAEAAGTPIVDPLWDRETSLFDVPPTLEKLPFVVIVIDEFADMIMIVGKKVEELIVRIAQKARAAGIHLILATQRPSVDVITGLLKSNIPTRISFQVSSKIDSRTVLDQPGAETLLGYGDMLYLPPGVAMPMRVHGAFVDDHEVHAVVDDWKLRGEPDYLEEILDGPSEPLPGIPSEQAEMQAADGGDADPLYDQAVAIVTESRKASISSVQRRLKIGYNRAARLVEEMEASGVVSEMQSNGQREVLAPPPPK
tara:strand:- start:2807 stop:5668 length:2862 start_codon:yes stop_codon:yes gene_type:complete